MHNKEIQGPFAGEVILRGVDIVAMVSLFWGLLEISEGNVESGSLMVVVGGLWLLRHRKRLGELFFQGDEDGQE